MGVWVKFGHSILVLPILLKGIAYLSLVAFTWLVTIGSNKTKYYFISANPEKERSCCVWWIRLALPLNLRFYRESSHASENVLWKNIFTKVIEWSRSNRITDHCHYILSLHYVQCLKVSCTWLLLRNQYLQYLQTIQPYILGIQRKLYNILFYIT